MKKCVNGKIVEMTEQEIEEIKRAEAEAEEMRKKQPPTSEERIAQLEAQNTQYELALCEIYERTL